MKKMCSLSVRHRKNMKKNKTIQQVAPFLGSRECCLHNISFHISSKLKEKKIIFLFSIVFVGIELWDHHHGVKLWVTLLSFLLLSFSAFILGHFAARSPKQFFFLFAIKYNSFLFIKIFLLSFAMLFMSYCYDL